MTQHDGNETHETDKHSNWLATDISTTEGDKQPKAEVDLFFTLRNDGFPYAKVYDYSLASIERSIRVIHLLPGAHDDIISCQLVGPVALGAANGKFSAPYEAVSYCAGDVTDCLPILLNGHPFNIFRNLLTVLEQVCLSDTERVLWIDQICMNQRDIPERNAQVQLMRHIHQQATGTQIWLGLKVPGTDAAFDLLEDILTKYRDGL